MYIDQELCTGCELCVSYCPMRAICCIEATGQVEINREECVECEVCRRADVCPSNALAMPQLEWPRILRNRFSNPLVTHPDTGVPGRGTEEMKTNEVTGRFRRGQVGMGIELGRPGTGTRLYDVEKVAMCVAELGIQFEPHNPVTWLMKDKTTGKMREDVLNEKVLSAIIEFDLPREKIVPTLEKLKEVMPEIDTVFSLALSCRLEADGSNPMADLVKEAGFNLSINGKTNVGLGRPLAKED